MEEFNILWIDDDWANASPAEYGSLNKIKTEIQLRNKGMNIKTVSDIATGLAIIGRVNGTLTNEAKKFDLIIIDLNFGCEYEGLWSDLIQRILEKRIQFLIYTNHRATYNNDLVRIREKCSDYLIDIYDKNDTKRFVDDIEQISNFVPVTIVHFCDFHYNSLLEGKDKNNQEALLDNFIDFLSKEHQSTPIDFYIFSGDFAAKKPKDEFDPAAAYLRKMIKNTTNDMDKLLLVPGNHDVNWDDYERGLLSDNPGLYLKQFYEKLFDNSLNFISGLSGYTQMGLNTNDFDFFCFSKKFRKGQIKILGLNSVLLDPAMKGHGQISDSVIDYIKKQWENELTSNEFRIATFHHNVLPPFSKNDLEENTGIVNAGKVIELLSELGCDLLLNGHCHFSGVYNFSFSSLNHSGYSSMKYLTTLSTGTTGGYSPQYDRARSFNIIQIFPTKDKNKKLLRIIPVIYDSTKNRWEKYAELSTEIIQNR